MNLERICPHCGQPNPNTQDICSRCGKSLLSNTTIITAAEVLNIDRPAEPASSQFEQDALYFFVAGADQNDPVIHRGQSSVIMGRRSDEMLEGQKLIDLSHYDALDLGVSRQHARIDYDDGAYMIIDLNSSNGTWLNGNRLEANKPHLLHRGDHIQLGHLMMMVYYFQSPKT